MALLIGVVTERELRSIREAGWEVAELAPAAFRRFFLRDPGHIDPGSVVAFITLNYTLSEVAAALGNGNEPPPPLRFVPSTSNGRQCA